MKRALLVNLPQKDLINLMWDILDEEMSEEQRIRKFVLVPTVNHGTIMMFHSLLDGSPNILMIRKFLFLKRTGKASHFMCCNPEKIRPGVRKYHIVGNFKGEIKVSDAKRRGPKHSLMILEEVK